MIEPILCTPQEQERHLRCSQLLNEGWDCETTLDGYIFHEDNQQNYEIHNNEWTYGEITEMGARQLFVLMNLMHPTDKKKVFFLDMGSGLGKLVAQAYMEIPSLSRVMGIELSKKRHRLACKSWKSIQAQAEKLRLSDLPIDSEQQLIEEVYDKEDISPSSPETYIAPATTLDLIHGDFLEENITDVTHIFVSSLCFSSSLMARLGGKLSMEGTSLQCVASLKPFPVFCERSLGVPLLQNLEMTWTSQKGGEAFFYWPQDHRDESSSCQSIASIDMS